MQQNLFYIGIGLTILINILIGCTKEPLEIGLDSIELSEVSAELHIGESKVLDVSFSPVNVTDKTVTWSTSNPNVATVSNGVVIAANAGTATITAMSQDKTATCAVTVSETAVTSIMLDYTDIELKVNEYLTLTATVTPENATDKSIIWSSSDDSVATVSNGVVIAHKIGTSVISAKAGEDTAVCTVTVTGTPVEELTLDKTYVTLNINETMTLLATVSPSDAADITVTWSTSDANIATVIDGVVTTLKIGTATITATAGDKTATCDVTIGENIIFKDELVKQKVVEFFDKNGDREISYEEASSTVDNDFTRYFFTGVPITSFDELKYFDGITALPVGLFSRCPELKSVSIPSSVTALGDFCFEGCTGLTSIEIPSSVTALGHRCFYGCTSLSSIEIPSSVTALGDSCFSDCTSLSSVKIPSSVTTLGYRCFSGCTSLSSIEIPSSVTALGNGCFSGCTSLSSIKIPSSVVLLGDNCFNGCTSLSSIEIPSSVTALGPACFRYCKSLSSIEIPSSVTALGDSCFYGCTSLSSIEIPSSVKEIGDGILSACSKLEKIDSNNSVDGGRALIIDGVMKAFAPYGLKEYFIPSSVTALGNSCFSGCTSLSSVKIPPSVTSLGGGCFEGCTSLSSIKIPPSVTALGNSCFYGCTSLSSVKIPSSVTALGNSCFYGCKNLSEIRCYAVKVPSVGTLAFYKTQANYEGYLYVPEESIKLYAQNSQWRIWKHIQSLK